MTTKLSTSNIQTQTLNVLGGPKITAIEVTDSSYNVLDDTAVSLTGGYIKITGTGFTSGCRVLINNTPASSVTFVNSTTVRAQVGAKDAGTYVVYLVNSNGGVAISVDGLTYSATPTWSSGSTLETQRTAVPISIQLSAASAQTYTLAAGSTLPTGLSLSSGGLLNGTVTIETQTTYSFTINATDAENQDSPRTFSLTVTVAILDPYFTTTSLIVRGIGSNGATNNTFLDSSTNGISITNSVGTPIQGSYSPYNQASWSNYFDGSGDYLTFPNSSAFAFGTGSFTIEFWINGPLNNDKFILGGRAAIGTMHITTGGSGSTAGVLRYVGSSTIVSGNVITDDSWHHCAIVRNGSSNITLYVDGISRGTGTDTTNYTTTSGTWYIGSNDTSAPANILNGYISNLRIVKGTAVYTSDFTPSTTPLTAVTNTALLTCQSPRLIDNSTNNLTITRSGDTSTSSFSPLAPYNEYAANSMGGSVYFDGSSALLAANNTGCNFGTGEFTVDFWMNPSSLSSSQTMLIGGNSGGSLTLRMTDSAFLIDRYNSALDLSGSATSQVGVWAHIAFVRQSNTLRIYRNGVQLNSGATSASYNLNNATVGHGGSIGIANYNGYISGLRAIKGQCLYPDGTTFTPPTSPPTSTANTSLVLNFTNHSINDATRHHVIQTVGDAKISTGQAKFSGQSGGSSMFFDGVGDYLKIPSTPMTNLGSANFTVEMWVYKTSSDNNFTLFRKGVATVIYELKTDSDRWVWQAGGSNIFVTGGGVTQNTWVHVALVRNGTTTTLYVNGTAVASGTSVNASENTDPLQIGFGDRTFAGYMSNFRMSKGIARYTANFTPPTDPFPVQ